MDRIVRVGVATSVLAGLIALGAGCAGESVERKRFGATDTLEIREAGLDPATPVAGVRPTAWVVARNALEVRVFFAFGEAEPTSLPMDPVTEADEFRSIRYETGLPPMSGREDLHVWFEVRDREDVVTEPRTAPQETLDFAHNLPELPEAYVTPPLAGKIAPRECIPDPSFVFDQPDCMAQYTFPFPTMTEPYIVPETEATSIATLQRGIGVDLGNGESYFFPHQVFVWHEGSNQNMGGTRTAMTY